MSKKQGIKRGTPEHKAHCENIQRNRRESDLIMRHMARQELIDALILTLNDELGFGKKRIKKFCDALNVKWNEVHSLYQEDYKDDELMAYAKGKIDEALLKILGPELFEPYEQRFLPDGYEHYAIGWRRM